MPRKITPEDFMKISMVSDPQTAPDGERTACVRKFVDTSKMQYRSEIWVVPSVGEPRRFTGGEWSDSSPRWSPDGKSLAFLSNRKKPESQIYLIPADGGEARPLTQLTTEGSIGGIRWSPDGTKIAFLFRAAPEAYRKAAVEERTKAELPPPPRFHTRLRYRLDGFGYYDGEFSQVWAADAATGEAKQLTTGDWNCQLSAWSPDSTTLAFLSDRRDDSDIAPSDDALWTVPADGGELTRIPAPVGDKSALVWSPDGTRFAYAGNPDPTDWWGTKNERLFVLPAAGGEARDLTGHTDVSLGYLTLSDVHETGAGDLIQWSADSTALVFAVSTHGETRLNRVELKSGTITDCGFGGELAGFDTNGSAAVFVQATDTNPGELYVNDHQRTSFNRPFLEEVQIAAPEAISVDNGDGGTVPGWILRPPDFDAAQKYPLVLYIHGGPHAQYGDTFFHELQLLAAEGYVVLYTNPRGSKGYGEAHTKAIAGDWGNRDFADLMAAVDYAAGLNYVDEGRLAIMGGSYGGYMTAWAVGHTDRFRCAIADRLVGNLHSMAGTCDFALMPDSYFRGNAWRDPSDLWRHSPLAYADKINTPLLIIHSDGDLRCPHGQAEELFAALRMQRKTVEYVRYPAESSHGLSRNGPPALRLDRLKRNLAWLDKWLKPSEE